MVTVTGAPVSDAVSVCAPVLDAVWPYLSVPPPVLDAVSVCASCVSLSACSKRTLSPWGRWCWHWPVTLWLVCRERTCRKPWSWCPSTTLLTLRTSFCKIVMICLCPPGSYIHSASLCYMFCFLYVSHCLSNPPVPQVPAD